MEELAEAPSLCRSAPEPDPPHGRPERRPDQSGVTSERLANVCSMNEDDAFQERLGIMNDGQLGRAYDLTASEWGAAGVSKDVFLQNMTAKRTYEDLVRPFRVAYEAAVAMSDNQVVRDAKHAYEETLETLHHGQGSQTRSLAEITREGQEARRAYDAAIVAAGDERVIKAKREYEEAAKASSKKFARSLR